MSSPKVGRVILDAPLRTPAPRRAFATLAALTLLLLVLAPHLQAAEPQSFYVNYSARVPTAPLLAHPLSIVHPGAELDLDAAQKAGNRVLAYVSVGEVAHDAPYRAEVLRRQLPFAGRNETWRSDLIDLSDARWPDFLVDTVAAPAARRGFDGFFLDTLDSVQLIDAAAPDSPRRTAALAGLIATIKKLRAAFPQKQIVINRGLFAFDALRDVVDGVLVESLYETHDFATKAHRPVPPADTEALLAALRPVSAAGRAVYVLDYADPAAPPERAQATAAKIRAHGFHAFVSTPALDGVMLAPLRPVARRICALFGNLSPVPAEDIHWPTDSFTAQRLQTPLEWLGYEVDFFRILQPSDLPALGAEYRAIVIPRFWRVPPEVEGAVVDWLIAQRAAGRKLLLFGSLPFRDLRQRARFMKAFGLGGTGIIASPPLKLETLARDDALLGYEEKVPPLQVNHHDLQAPADATKILSLRGQPDDGPAVVFDAIFTCSWGGLAFDPYVLFRRADFREFWHLDPFGFLQRILGDFGAPAPDVTTRDGLRLYMSHIDGDGFANFSRVELGKRSAEIVRDRILKKYPLPVTVSIIEAELRGLIRTQRADDSPALEAIARDIFALPHVEAASHSFSHPFFWIEGDREAVFYDDQNLELKIHYPKLDLAREINGSVSYINERLAAPGRPVRVFLWSGNCRPPPEALRLVRELGLENVNGGDTIISRKDQTLTAVAPRSMPWHGELQVHAPNQNENVYTNNWRGPLFGTFLHTIDTFNLTETPRRLKPVNVYYHFYSADYPASQHALETIHNWVISQPLHAITLSHYARIARDARATTLYHAGPDRWLAVNAGDSRTFRLSPAVAARLDLRASRGVTGWKTERDQAYVHTDGTRVVTFALAAPSLSPADFPRLESSSAEIEFRIRTSTTLEFTATDLRPIQVTLAGLPPRRLAITINDTAQQVTPAPDGRLPLTLPPTARVRLTIPASSASHPAAGSRLSALDSGLPLHP